MNTTFVLGAGFSVDASDPRMPLARELRERVLGFIKFDRHSSYSALLDQSYEYHQGQFYAGLEQIDANGALQFEELFIQLRRQGITSKSQGPAYVAEWVLRIGCARLLWCIHGLNPFPEWHYRNLASWMRREIESSRNRTAVVSFNWDVVVETALTNANIPWSYSLSVQAMVPVLKPHGSINWNRYLRENLRNDTDLWRPIGSRSGFSYPAETPLQNPDQQGISPDLRFMLFPGDPELPEQDKDIQRIWGDVETVLAESSKVIFIGYSLPDYDSFASSFLRKHISGEVEVYNPSTEDQKKYKNLFGGQIVKDGKAFSSCPYAR